MNSLPWTIYPAVGIQISLRACFCHFTISKVTIHIAIWHITVAFGISPHIIFYFFVSRQYIFSVFVGHCIYLYFRLIPCVSHTQLQFCTANRLTVSSIHNNIAQLATRKFFADYKYIADIEQIILRFNIRRWCCNLYKVNT